MAFLFFVFKLLASPCVVLETTLKCPYDEDLKNVSSDMYDEMSSAIKEQVISMFENHAFFCLDLGGHI